ncbi:MAG: NAD-dependent epimerase/dehydratase family protein [Candidatus Phlomobacter fragariae]
MLTILGGSGFIGTRLANQLTSQQIDFKIIDINKSLVHPDKWIFGDVTKAETLLAPLKDASIIINLAAQHQDNVRPISLYYEVNVEGAKNVCQVAEKLDIKHIIFTSSVAVYGFVAQETDEEGKFQPFDDYGKSKLAAEYVYDGWQAKDSQRILVTIRPTVVFGEHNRGNVYNLFKQIAAGCFLMIGSGNNQKSMAYVENVAAFLYFVTKLKAGRHIFNYVDKPDFTMNQLTDIICQALQKQKSNLRVPYSLGILAGYCFDLFAKISGKNFPISSIRVRKFCACTKFKSNTIAKTGFEPPVTLAKGIENNVQFEFKKLLD